MANKASMPAGAVFAVMITSMLAIAEPPKETVNVTAGEFAFKPGVVTVSKGEEVVLVLNNQGALSHNLVIPELDLEIKSIQTDENGRIRFTVDRTGTFVFYCSVPGHKEAGMTGELRVEKNQETSG